MQAEPDSRDRDAWQRPSRAVLEVVIGGSYAAFLLAHFWLAPGSASPLSKLAVAAIAGLPLASGFLARQLGWDRRLQRRWDLATLALLGLGLVLQAGSGVAQQVLLVLTFSLCSFLARHRRSGAQSVWTERSAAWLLALAPAQVLCAMAAAPSSAWLLHLPLVVGAVCVGALIQSARFSTGTVNARGPRRLRREVAARSAEGVESRERLRAALPLTLAMLGLTAVSYLALAALPRPRLRPAAREDSATTEGTATAAPREAVAETARVFGEELVPGGALSEERQEVVMTVRARRSADALAPGEDVGSLYLRGAVLDTFTETTLRASGERGPAALRDEDDGARDGWTRLATDRPREPLWLEIEQQSFRSGGGTWEVLFAPQPALAVRLARVHFDPDGLLALRQAESPPVIAYEVMSSLKSPQRAKRGAETAGTPGERYLQLPRPSVELDLLAELAAEHTRSATTDLEKVESLLAYFAREYRYSLRTQDVPGIEGIASFVRRRRGHCTSFAATSVLMLRTLGLPARVATGFLAQEYSPERGRYLVTNKNGHAWIEVHFAEVGWVSFDPTPRRARELALSAASTGEDDGVSAWWRELRGDLAAWSASGAAEVELDLLTSTLLDGPRAFWVSAARAPIPVACAVIAALAAVFASRRRRRRVLLSRASPPRVPPPTPLVEDLLEVLERDGYIRRPGETLLELAQRIHHAAPDPELVPAVEELYRQRFGGAPPTETRALGDWLALRRARTSEAS